MLKKRSAPLERPDHLISIDPGRHSGIARFSFGRLVLCEAATPAQIHAYLEQVFGHVVVIERPQIYDKKKAKAGGRSVSPDALITLAINVGGYVRSAERNGNATRLVKPAAWKAQLPKEVVEARALALLSPEERACIHTQSLDAIEACAIGLSELGRFQLVG